MPPTYCAACGHQLEPAAAFCPECGHAVGGPPSVPSLAPGPAPAAPPPSERGPRNWLILAAAILAVLAVGVGALALARRSGSHDDTASGGEVFLVAADDPGPDPYATDLTVASPSTTAPPSTTAATTTALAGGGRAVATRSGGTPGLYGGTRDVGRCDPAQLVDFLAANPAKARAWVAALDADPTMRWRGGSTLTTADIPAYVDELTPVTLVRDTRVTNHGYRNGRPTSIQAVLQAGTAVMVDRWGVPRVKCGCGNPLTAPAAVRGPFTYTGAPWPGWSPANVTVVVRSTVVVQQFVLVNLSGPGTISRPTGTDGGDDTVGPATPTTTTTEVPTSTEATSTTGAPTTTAVPSGDFCAIAEPWVPEFRNFVLAGFGSGTFPDATKIIAGAEQLEAVAPTPAVKADLGVLLAFLRNPTAAGADIELAAMRAYLLDTCHIDVDG